MLWCNVKKYIYHIRIFHAVKESTQEECVLKLVISSNTPESQIGQQLIYNEATTLNNLVHKNIVKCLGYGIGNLQLFGKSNEKGKIYEAHYLVLEYLGGGSLLDVVGAYVLDEDFIKKVLLEIINALAFIQALGYIHHDIKPENVMFDKDLNVKLIDFGLTSSIYGDIGDGLCYFKSGSKPFWAPEILITNYPLGYLPARAEVYAVGLTVFLMKFGFLPTYKNAQDESFWIQAEEEGKLEVSAGLKDLIKKMLIINPFHRITLQEMHEHPWLVQ